MTAPAPLLLEPALPGDLPVALGPVGQGRGAAVAGIVRRLQSRVPRVAVEAFPDEPEAYQLIHPHAALLVAYVDSSRPPDAGADLDGVGYGRRSTFDVNVIARSLLQAGAWGAYELIDAVEAALAAWALPGWGPLELESDAFLGRERATWQYRLRFVVQTLVVAPAAEEALLEGAPLAQVTWPATTPPRHASPGLALGEPLVVTRPPAP